MNQRDNVLFLDHISDVREALAQHASNHTRLFVLCDENTLDHCFPALAEDFEALQEAEILVVEPGEASKNWDIAHHLFAQLLEFEADKRCLLINLGGGVVTDLGGWIAANYKRGMDWVNIPTTLMAMTDAAIGGKTGIDLLHYKNMVGTIAFPIQTIVCPEFLETLPPIEIRSGQAEMLKHALLQSRNDFDAICAAIAEDDLPDTDAIIRSASVKLAIVERDPHESNERKTLNLGHTIGHALESYFLTQDEHIPHGLAVAAGIAIESSVSTSLQLLAAEHSALIVERCIGLFNLTDYTWPSFEDIVPFIMNDKKNSEGKIHLALLEDFGTCRPSQVVNIEDLATSYANFQNTLQRQA